MHGNEQQRPSRSEGRSPNGGGDLGAAGHDSERQCLEFCPICRTADVVRATMPAEFQEHWHSVQRELLLAVRSLVDHYLDHVEKERRKVVHVEDIPIQ
jgi:hypothetical protein